MIKAFIKYLLSACILVLSGHSLLHARVNGDHTQHSSKKASELPVTAGFIIEQNSPGSTISYVSSRREKENYDLKALVVYDDDDDEVISKKHPANGSYSVSDFFTRTSGHSFSNTKKIKPFSNHLSYPASSWYLMCRVFRI